MKITFIGSDNIDLGDDVLCLDEDIKSNVELSVISLSLSTSFSGSFLC